MPVKPNIYPSYDPLPSYIGDRLQNEHCTRYGQVWESQPIIPFS